MPRQAKTEDVQDREHPLGVRVSPPLLVIAIACASVAIWLAVRPTPTGTPSWRPVIAVLVAGCLLFVASAIALQTRGFRDALPRARRRWAAGCGLVAGVLLGAAMCVGIAGDSSPPSRFVPALLALGAFTGLLCGASVRAPRTDADPGPVWSTVRVPAAMLWGAVVGIFVSELSWAGLIALSKATEHLDSSPIDTAVAALGMTVGAFTRALLWADHRHGGSHVKAESTDAAP